MSYIYGLLLVIFMVICIISFFYRLTFPKYLNLKDFISEELEEVRNCCNDL